jgi:2-pyrone-4,6-dicarboxylate lactonase
MKTLPKCRMPDAAPRRPGYELPQGATDCHIHVFGPARSYPLADTRLFEPPDVAWGDYLKVMEQLGLERAVIVHSAVYGADNSVTADAIATAPSRFRGIAVLNENVTEAQLENLTAGGFRGFRVNLVSGRGVQLAAAKKLAEKVRPFGWHVQFLMDIDALSEFDDTLGKFPVEVVIDHMGRPHPESTPSSPAFQAMMRLLRDGKGWSKLSAPYRTSRQLPPYRDMRPFADALTRAAPDRLIWGTDWPHVMVEGQMPNDGDLASDLADWVSDAEIRRRILVENPQRLYGF